ncbi:hypothetical protein CTI12_AA150900 [Artemisia annua]|uniref:Uncharacterized protein n=1 Tax=Artemisia annua TaxID=35608 RepID=A0A2U1PHL4_ARTAN|nr:hypothetical protein CTI12_AA150900 [Artemisia annua]
MTYSKASMLDEIIDYVKFPNLQVKADLEEAKTQENGKVQSAYKRWKLDLMKHYKQSMDV